ncbi:MAG: ATP-binding protein [Desulfobacterales bacterium]|jgi:anti-sigma regulatory factor (Ser/Thr protein kinase)|nr:ATP-binding protein [Desulfobacterales bacterium]
MGQPPRTFSFSLKNDIAELQTLGRQIESIGRALDLSKRCLFEINLALDELFTNIISYGFTDGGEHRIELNLSAADEVLTVTIADDGVAFNPTERPAPALPDTVDDCRVGGLGIYLIQNLMDEVHYRREDKKNILTLKKKLERIRPPCRGGPS